MTALKENAVTLVASVSANMQAGDGKTTLYTVPTGKKFIPVMCVVRNPSASLADGTDFDFGDGASCDTWKQTVDLSGLTATTDCYIVSNDAAKFTVFDAGDVFGVYASTGTTADATATIDVFGYLFNA